MRKGRVNVSSVVGLGFPWLGGHLSRGSALAPSLRCSLALSLGPTWLRSSRSGRARLPSSASSPSGTSAPACLSYVFGHGETPESAGRSGRALSRPRTPNPPSGSASHRARQKLLGQSLRPLLPPHLEGRLRSSATSAIALAGTCERTFLWKCTIRTQSVSCGPRW